MKIFMSPDIGVGGQGGGTPAQAGNPGSPGGMFIFEDIGA